MSFQLQDTIAGMEEAARKLPTDDTQDLRMRVCGILRSSKLPKDNITRSQRVALKEMKGWDDEVILPAEKGNAMVVMERSDYEGKVRELLSDTSTYRRLPNSSTGDRDVACYRSYIRRRRLQRPSTIDLGLPGPKPPDYTVYLKSTSSPSHLGLLFRALDPPLTSFPNT